MPSHGRTTCVPTGLICLFSLDKLVSGFWLLTWLFPVQFHAVVIIRWLGGWGGGYMDGWILSISNLLFRVFEDL